MLQDNLESKSRNLVLCWSTRRRASFLPSVIETLPRGFLEEPGSASMNMASWIVPLLMKDFES